ncbi:sensor domain-containing diguanylate cyclase [Ammoniphilus resinae]|uniref:Diguanylate cyclase (GGDEF)-like protein n=1 Tax=Ammoniphilus resinae TaxID=861532 RepID=A0ABS4GLX9_9BACL|nr:sensor domain-containing diguanylate cyclase [Ammoniphilus resinae]MBP1931254.1 diguanylate cyclase (GGDEF)-like protein [Ammoniphilus resinae]
MFHRLSLRFVIISFVTIVMVCMTLIHMIVGYQVTRKSIIQNTLHMNEAYAAKLALVTDSLLRSSQHTLLITARQLAEHMDDKFFLDSELKNLIRMNNTFHSLLVADTNGRILRTVPYAGMKGEQSLAKEMNSVLQEEEPYISQPFQSIQGKMFIFISIPITDLNGKRVGVVGGTINLQEPNFLYQVLGQHFYKDGSFVYVVDNQGHLIYHPKVEILGEDVSSNTAVKKILKGESGSQRVIHNGGIDVLTGYATVPVNGWGVISQTPTEIALKPTWTLLKEMILTQLPFFVCLLLLSWWISNQIYRPLRRLSVYASHLLNGNSATRIPEVPYFYKELKELHDIMTHHLRRRVDHLIYEAQTDQLTGLINRRTMHKQMELWVEQGISFSLVLLDIDFFKKINDTYGHQMGDHVLQFLAHLMKEEVRAGDLCCRLGGEEFIILLPKTDLVGARNFAERLRDRLENSPSPTGVPITVSIGLAAYPQSAASIDLLLVAADEALYRAKNQGRNQTVM